jgi:glutaredoxin
VAEARLYTRADCHLCQRARAILDAIARDYPLAIRELDVDADPALRARYGLSVPVVEVDGRLLAAGRVSEFRLRRALGLPATPRAWVGLARSALKPE